MGWLQSHKLGFIRPDHHLSVLLNYLEWQAGQRHHIYPGISVMNCAQYELQFFPRPQESGLQPILHSEGPVPKAPRHK